jgi:DNA-binding CsgD family transcriptional regulator
MTSTAAGALDAFFRDARLERAVREALGMGADEAAAGEESRRLAAAIFASAGHERGLAGVSGLGAIGCKTIADAIAWCGGLTGGPISYDYLTAGVVLSWSGERDGVYDLLREAHDRALQERRFHVAVAARERLAHHAVLFGDTAQARVALDDALATSEAYELTGWRVRCVARVATLAFDTDDLARAADALATGATIAARSELEALFAPAGIRLALVKGDAALRERWFAPGIAELALRSSDTGIAAAATTALLLGSSDMPAIEGGLSAAVRRALLMVDAPSNHVEFLAFAARYGGIPEAELAMALLQATLAPQRRYLQAHYRLAHAHALLRAEERTAAIDSAGDAARAFDAMGMRHWANDAMLLLVRHDEMAERPMRRRPTAVSLTRREQQVAHLIRRGASNREVAHALQISEHTVERHVSSILSRLGLRSRWQIVDARITGSEH